MSIVLAGESRDRVMRTHALAAILLMLLLVPSARSQVTPIFLGAAYLFFWLEKRAGGTLI